MTHQIARGDVVWETRSPTIGREQAKHRPWLVLSEPTLHRARGLLIEMCIRDRLQHFQPCGPACLPPSERPEPAPLVRWRRRPPLHRSPRALPSGALPPQMAARGPWPGPGCWWCLGCPQASCSSSWHALAATQRFAEIWEDALREGRADDRLRRGRRRRSPEAEVTCSRTSRPHSNGCSICSVDS